VLIPNGYRDRANPTNTVPADIFCSLSSVIGHIHAVAAMVARGAQIVGAIHWDQPDVSGPY